MISFKFCTLFFKQWLLNFENHAEYLVVCLSDSSSIDQLKVIYHVNRGLFEKKYRIVIQLNYTELNSHGF